MGLALRFRISSGGQTRLRESAAAWMFCAVAATACMVSMTPAQAQSFIWGGTGSTTATTDYNLGTNWSTPPAGAPPVAAGKAAIFDATGSPTVGVTAGPIAPNSWTFNANSQSYTISGADVSFSLAGPTGGIINNANAGQTITISNNIGESVAGVQVQQLDNSTLVLSGINTYSGGTTISGGTLVVTNNSSVGTGAVTINTGTFQADGLGDLTFANNFKVTAPPFGSVIDTNGVTVTFNGVVSGPGALTVVDSAASGALILNGTNTYTGGTTICSCATLQLGDATHVGTIIGDVTNEGFFKIVNGNTAGITSITNDGGLTTFFTGNTAGTMTINNIFGGETDFGVGGADFATAGNAIITNQTGGATVFNGMSTAGNATITNRNGGTTVFLDSSNAGSASITNRFGGQTIFGSIGGSETPSAGTATIVNRFQGNTEFNASSTAASATITNRFGGSTDFFDTSDAGKATIITNNGGATFFHDFADGRDAAFITNGSGFVDFSDSAGPGGLGRITAGSIAGSGFYYIGAFNTLAVGTNNSSTEVSGVIADSCGCGPAAPGNLEKVGTGTLTLSGINTYTGTTTVSSGTLLVTGSIASSSVVFVDTGATLGGTGTVAPTFLFNGATLAPGLPTALGTLTVNDVLVFCNCTFYNVKVTSGGNDLTQVVSTGGPAIAPARAARVRTRAPARGAGAVRRRRARLRPHRRAARAARDAHPGRHGGRHQHGRRGRRRVCGRRRAR